MSPLMRGLAIALTQILLVAGVGGKLLYDREKLPRAWVKTTGVDPVMPIRGRYVSLRLVIDVDRESQPPLDEREMFIAGPVQLEVVDGSLHAAVTAQSTMALVDWTGPVLQRVPTPAGDVWTLAEPVVFFLPEGAADPTRLGPGEELWAEVTVPPKGPPRPIRLEVRK